MVPLIMAISGKGNLGSAPAGFPKRRAGICD